MSSSEEGVGTMDFHVGNYNNLSRRTSIIAFLCIDSTNSIEPLDMIQLEILALFIDSTCTWSYSAESLDRIHNMHNRSSFIIRHSLFVVKSSKNRKNSIYTDRTSSPFNASLHVAIETRLLTSDQQGIVLPSLSRGCPRCYRNRYKPLHPPLLPPCYVIPTLSIHFPPHPLPPELKEYSH